MKTIGRAAICVSIAVAASARLADAAESDRSASHGALGVRLSRDPAAGATVTAVYSESPARAVGLQPGDRIVSINGQVMTDSQKVIAALRRTAPGAKVEVGFVRLGKQRKLNVTLAGSRTVFQTKPIGLARTADRRPIRRSVPRSDATRDFTPADVDDQRGYGD